MPTQLFTLAAQGPLRSIFLQFYADTGDFSRRLSSVFANGKFTSLESVGDTDWDLPSDLRTVVKGIKKEFGTKYIFVWHAICGYWSGVGTPEVTVDTPEMRSLGKFNWDLSFF